MVSVAAGSGLWDPWSFNGVVGYFIIIMLLWTIGFTLWKVFVAGRLEGL